MKPYLALILALSLITPAMAQTIPDEAMKARALKRAYELNGNIMCCGSIDVSQDPVVTGIEITPETEFNALDAAAPNNETDICVRHNLRKVVSEDGKSWRCKR